MNLHLLTNPPCSGLLHHVQTKYCDSSNPVTTQYYFGKIFVQNDFAVVQLSSLLPSFPVLAASLLFSCCCLLAQILNRFYSQRAAYCPTQKIYVVWHLKNLRCTFCYSRLVQIRRIRCRWIRLRSVGEPYNDIHHSIRWSHKAQFTVQDIPQAGMKLWRLHQQFS